MRSLPRNLLLVAVIGVVSLTFVFLLAKNANTQSTSNKKYQEPDPIVMAIRRGGLREAARLKGNYIGSERTTGWAKYTIESLTSSSAAIVIGIPLSSSSSLAASGERINTDYNVKIQRVLKGKLEKGETISVVAPGGKVTFEDGTSAEIRTPDLGPIVENKRYVFFLRTSEEKLDAFDLIGGGQGVFELSSSDSTVKALGSKTDIVQQYNYKQIADFIGEVENAVRKYPDPLPCCN